jgi:hypothetical protein
MHYNDEENNTIMFNATYLHDDLIGIRCRSITIFNPEAISSIGRNNASNPEA